MAYEERDGAVEDRVRRSADNNQSYGAATADRRDSARIQDAHGDASRAAIDAPAHPLPAQRHGKIDYDLYLESQTSKFKIFSAQEDRRRRRSAVLLTVGIVAGVVLLWAIISHL